MEEKLKKFKDLQFTITKEMEESIFELLVIQQMLEENKLSKKERKLLQKQKDDMLKQFRYELHRLNPTQIALCNYFLYSKKNERDEN